MIKPEHLAWGAAERVRIAGEHARGLDPDLLAHQRQRRREKAGLTAEEAVLAIRAARRAVIVARTGRRR